MTRLFVAGWVLLAFAGCGGNDAPEAEAPAPDRKTTTTIVGSTAQPPPTDIDPAELELVRGLTRQFYERELAQLHARFSDEMQQDLTIERLTLLRDQVEQLYGKEVSVVGERSDVKGDYRGFVRWARFDKSEEVIAIEWYLRPDDRVAGFFVKPAKKSIDAAP